MEIQKNVETKNIQLIQKRRASNISAIENRSLNGSVTRRRKSTISNDVQENIIIKPKKKLIESEDAASGGVGLAVYGRYFKNIGIVMTVAAVMCNLINQATSVYSNSILIY